MFTTLMLSSVFGTGQPTAPTQLPPVTPLTIPAQAPVAAPANGNGEKPACEEPKAEEETPATKYFLEKLLSGTRAGCLLEQNGIKVFGWTSGNYTGSSNTGSNLPVTFNDFGNGGQLNQNWLEVVKAIDTSKKESQWGFRYAAILPGTDARFSIARGLGTVGRGDYPVDPMTYGYVERFNGENTTYRIGKWGTSCGYEVIDAVNTPFVSKSYMFQYNPFTHTGIQATTSLNDDLSVYYGVVTGNDVFIDPAATATFLGGIKWAPKDGKNALTLNVVINEAKFNVAENFANYDVFNVIFTHKFNDQNSYVADAGYSFINDVPNIGYAAWYGVANYFIHKHCNDKFVSTLRLEAFEDEEGFRTGFAGTFYEATFGVAYQATESIIVRPFARYDYNRNGPWQGDSSLYTGGIELIARW